MRSSKRGTLYSALTPESPREAALREKLRAENTQTLLDCLDTIAEKEEIDDIELLSALLDVLDEKAPVLGADETTPAESLERFKAEYPTLFAPREAGSRTGEGRGARGGRGLLRYAAVAALVCCLLFAGMIGAQASGWDIFGALAQWTQDTFHFVSDPAEPAREVSPYYEPFRQALEDQGLPGELAPTWYPEGFDALEPQVWNDQNGITVQIEFEDDSGRVFYIKAERNADKEYLEQTIYEKDANEIEVYTRNSRSFYIFDNIDTVTAIWSDGKFTERITGDISIGEIKKIIDSMGGN